MRKTLARPASVVALDERLHEEPDARFRSPSQRDRDRILYSSAFQRLSGITQVASPGAGHVFHSRLTHSLKVAQVARRLAERLQDPAVTSSAAIRDYLDPEATEAAALAHDFGHPPFGHLAEQELEQKTFSIGGFEGNAQSFRILTRLASRSVSSPGLNLSRRVLNGTIKYPKVKTRPHLARRLARQLGPERGVEKGAAYEADSPYFEWARNGCDPTASQTVEAALMDWADDVTYAVHDMDDFYRAGLIPLDRLCELDRELEDFQDYVALKRPDASDGLRAACEGMFRKLLSVNTRYRGVAEERINLRAVGSALITRYINCVTLDSTATGAWEIVIPDAYRNEVQALKQLTWRYVIERPSLAVIQRGHRRVISDLFDMYLDASAKPPFTIFPPAYGERLEAVSGNEATRTVVDLVASLTEASAIDIFRRTSGIRTGSVIDAAGELA